MGQQNPAPVGRYSKSPITIPLFTVFHKAIPHSYQLAQDFATIHSLFGEKSHAFSVKSSPSQPVAWRPPCHRPRRSRGCGDSPAPAALAAAPAAVRGRGASPWRVVQLVPSPKEGANPRVEMVMTSDGWMLQPHFSWSQDPACCPASMSLCTRRSNAWLRRASPAGLHQTCRRECIWHWSINYMFISFTCIHQYQ